MPKVESRLLEEFAYQAFRSVGAPEEDARIAAFHIVDSNLAGHDSHGVMALPGYINGAKKGFLDPGAPFELVKDEPTFAIVDGHRNFGHVVAHRATELAIQKARNATISCVAIRHVGHMGRMGGYPEMIAKAGMGGFICCGSGGVIHSVAPYGGTKGRTGTNPIAMAFPSEPDGRIILMDMATTVHAHGKMNVYVRQGKEFPDDWLLDADGRPTTDPKKFAAFRTFGGPVGYKGYALSFFVEILSGILTGDGYAHDTKGADYRPHFSNGAVIIAINVWSFLPVEQMKREILDMTQWITSSPPAEGFSKVMYPGEPEEMTRKERLAGGIPLDEPTWADLQKLAAENGLEKYLPAI